MNPVYGKKLVMDVRDGTYYFGDIRLPDPTEESSFGFDWIDMIQVGCGTFETCMPVSAVKIYSNITTIENARLCAKVMRFTFIDCDFEYQPSEIPQIYQN